MTEPRFPSESPDTTADPQSQELTAPLDPTSTQADAGGSAPSIDDKSGKRLD